MASDLIRVEVAYATPQRQLVIAIDLPAGSSAADAVMQSGIRRQFPEIPWPSVTLGIFSRLVPLNQVLQAGDRVEIYRPLLADPKTARRDKVERERRALQAKRSATQDLSKEE